MLFKMQYQGKEGRVKSKLMNPMRKGTKSLKYPLGLERYLYFAQAEKTWRTFAILCMVTVQRLMC